MRAFSFRIRPSIVILFISLVLPLFISLVAFTYVSNEKAAEKTAEQMIDRFNQEILTGLQQLVDPVTTLVRAASANAAAFPNALRSDEAFASMHAILTHSEDIASVYIGFEDGSFRAVYRTPPGVKFHNRPSPEGSVTATRWIDRRTSVTVDDVMQFLDQDGKVLEVRHQAANYDPRQRDWYQSTRTAHKTLLSGPYVFASNGRTGISIVHPVRHGDRLNGVMAIDVTLSSINDLLKSRQISTHSLSVVLDAQYRVIASSTEAGPSANVASTPAVRQIRELASDLPSVALGLMPRETQGNFFFTAPTTGQTHVARVSPVASKLEVDWTILIIAPMSDFLTDIKQNNQRMAILGLVAIVVQLLLIYGLSRQLARPLEQMAHRVSDIESLKFQTPSGQLFSHFSEVRKLSHSIDKMSQAIQAFSAFVPVDLVRSLMKSGEQLELGGHSRFLTIMFCDLESFSTLSENSPSQELLLRVSKYLEVATRAINEELGTVDKFIGDGVMAFWGAPTALDEHAWHACVAALKIQQRMKELNQAWIAQGLPPLNVRIGIHSDAVLVGNIGSPERMSYTVMGDGVNIAARLEGINKDFGTQICVSKSVFREAGERLQLRPLEDVTVKGRKTPVAVYELQGLKSATATAA